MSNEPEQPDELRLPEELAAYEARLAALPLAASRINRDEVLYRAGWAAAEAKLSLGNPPPLQGGARGGIADLCFDSQSGAEATVVNPSPVPSLQGRGSVAAWSLASAALAASLAVAGTWAILGGNASRGAVEAGDLRPPLASVADAAGGRAPGAVPAAAAPRDERGELAIANLESMLRWNQAAPSASLLAAVGRPQAQRWDQPIFVSTQVRAAAESNSAPPTMRALRDELLPAASENSGASPQSRRPSPLGDDTI